MARNTTLFTVNRQLEPYVTRLVQENREALIKAAVLAPEVQRDLLEINRLINEVKAKDPSQLAAWGLGCGNHCAVPELEIARGESI